MIARILIAIALLVAGALALLVAVFQGRLGELESPGEIARERRPEASVAASQAALATAAAGVGAAADKQILFGDFHVHTTYSLDAFLTSLPVMQGEGAHPPADACDFARHCSALDFYSINDHAESITMEKWAEIKDSVRQCNSVAGDSSSPDLVAFLGWEWTQMSADASTHYGHKNVVLLETADDRTPARPIAALGDAYHGMRSTQGSAPVVALSLRDLPNRQRYFDFLALRRSLSQMPTCEADVPVRDLPLDCSEAAATPRELFAKLDDWGGESIVIPHGNAWGNTTPVGIDWEKQLAGQHDPERQTLIEVYSGHGSSEEYRPWRHVVEGPDGAPACPPVSEGFEPECHRAGEIIRERCLGAGIAAEECERRAVRARAHFVGAGRAGPVSVPGEVAEDWLDAGQCTDCFKPAFLFRPGGSTQNALAVSGVGVPGAQNDPEARFRFGLIASSDNHTARAATGYKEFRALGMTDALHAEGTRTLRNLLPLDREPRPESQEIDAADVPLLPGGDERLSSFFYTGGLVAVHAAGRGRQAIWDALQRKEVYGTSGPRILLWFDLLNAPGGPAVMGSELEMSDSPRFRVRAVGSRKQRPGCPESASRALGAERLEALCFGECHNPGDERRIIERVEIVRIRPRVDASEDVASLVQDPWKAFACPPSEAGCVVEFEDEEFASAGRDTVYYARVLEQPSPMVNGDPLRCERDSEGACVATRVCRSGGEDPDECLFEAQARAWSSPIFIDRPAE